MTKNECSGIWVFAEQRGGRLDRTALELLGKAQELKKNTGEEVTAVLLGSGVEALADTLAHHGADRVILARSENLKAYSARPYQKVLTAMCEKYKPSIFVFGATAQGRDLAPGSCVLWAPASLPTRLTWVLTKRAPLCRPRPPLAAASLPISPSLSCDRRW